MYVRKILFPSPSLSLSFSEWNSVEQKLDRADIHIISIQLYYIILHYITLHYIILHYIILYYIILHYIILHYITLHYITSHHITLHDITLHDITLHNIILYDTYCCCLTLTIETFVVSPMAAFSDTVVPSSAGTEEGTGTGMGTDTGTIVGKGSIEGFFNPTWAFVRVTWVNHNSLMIIKKKFSRVDFYNININNNNNIYVRLIQFFHLRSPMMRWYRWKVINEYILWVNK